VAEDHPTWAERLEDWVEAGLVPADRAAAIRRFEAERRPLDADPQRPAPVAADGSARGPSPAAEVAGYVGATLALVAAGILLGDVWADVPTLGRSVLLAVVTGVLLLGGVALRRSDVPAAGRLTGVLWAGAVAGAGWTVGVAADGSLADPGEATALAASITAAVLGLVLHRLRPSSLQLIAVSLAVGATAVSALAIADVTTPLVAALVLWGLGLAWVVLGLAGWLRPETTAVVLGLLGMGVGCQVGAFDEQAGIALLLALASIAGLVVGGIRARSTLLAAFAMAGLVVFVPQAVAHFLGDSVGAPLLLLVVGLLLVAVAVGTAVLRRGD
jgi:hypothetical protein